MEVLGGNGYVEEFNLARIYREAPVNSIWEGSGNIMCLDVLRALRRAPAAADILFDEMRDAAGADKRLRMLLDALRDRAGSIEEVPSARIRPRSRHRAAGFFAHPAFAIGNCRWFLRVASNRRARSVRHASARHRYKCDRRPRRARVDQVSSRNCHSGRAFCEVLDPAGLSGSRLSERCGRDDKIRRRRRVRAARRFVSGAMVPPR